MSPLLHRGLGIAAVTALTCGMVAAPTGSLMVFDLTSSKLLREIDLGGQPDSIDISPDGEWAAIAVENQRDEEFTPEGLDEGALPQLPARFLASIDLRGEVADWQVKRTELTGLQGMMAADDPEPEYVKFSPDGSQVPPPCRRTTTSPSSTRAARRCSTTSALAPSPSTAWTPRRTA